MIRIYASRINYDMNGMSTFTSFMDKQIISTTPIPALEFRNVSCLYEK